MQRHHIADLWLVAHDQAVEGELVRHNADLHAVAILYTAGQNFFGERILDGFLDHPLQGPCAIGRIIAFFSQQAARRF